MELSNSQIKEILVSSILQTEVEKMPSPVQFLKENMLDMFAIKIEKDMDFFEFLKAGLLKAGQPTAFKKVWSEGEENQTSLLQMAKNWRFVSEEERKEKRLIALKEKRESLLSSLDEVQEEIEALETPETV